MGYRRQRQVQPQISNLKKNKLTFVTLYMCNIHAWHGKDGMVRVKMSLCVFKHRSSAERWAVSCSDCLLLGLAGTIWLGD
jgi:hypothetical protein